MSAAVGADAAPAVEADPAVAGGWGDALARASAVALLVVLPVQVAATVLVDDPGVRTAADALARWSSPGWRALDWLLVCLGALHAAVGITRAASTSRLGPGARTVVGAVAVAGAALLVAAMTLAVLWVGR